MSAPTAPHARQSRDPLRGAYVRDYCAAMLWASTDESDDTGGQPMDASYTAADIAPESLADIRAQLANFLFKARRLLRDATRTDNARSEYASHDVGRCASVARQTAHDFFLTRCGHGVGFWDRGLGDVGDALSELAKQAGEVWPYVGDDGRIYR